MKLSGWVARIAAVVLPRPVSSPAAVWWPVPPAARLPRPPRVVMPPDPDRRPWPGPNCVCGRQWTDTPQGWYAADRHNDADLSACGEAVKQHRRERDAVRRAIIHADPELSRQQREYDRAVQTRRLPRRRQQSKERRAAESQRSMDSAKRIATGS